MRGYKLMLRIVCIVRRAISKTRHKTFVGRPQREEGDRIILICKFAGLPRAEF